MNKSQLWKQIKELGNPGSFKWSTKKEVMNAFLENYQAD